nr:uncharacterized protein LOC127338267 [Lolium perenne]
MPKRPRTKSVPTAPALPESLKPCISFPHHRTGAQRTAASGGVPCFSRKTGKSASPQAAAPAPRPAPVLHRVPRLGFSPIAPIRDGQEEAQKEKVGAYKSRCIVGFIYGDAVCPV